MGVYGAGSKPDWRWLQPHCRTFDGGFRNPRDLEAHFRIERHKIQRAITMDLILRGLANLARELLPLAEQGVEQESPYVSHGLAPSCRPAQRPCLSMEQTYGDFHRETT